MILMINGIYMGRRGLNVSPHPLPVCGAQLGDARSPASLSGPGVGGRYEH